MLHSLGKFSVTGVLFNMVVIIIVSFVGKYRLIEDIANFIMEKLSNIKVSWR